MEDTMAPKLFFAMNYCERDKTLASKSMSACQKLYPNDLVVGIPDTPRLKLAQFGGQWTQRWMEAALADAEAEIIIKIDPDTRALKACRAFPTTDIFGQLAPEGTYYPKSNGIICGGAIGFTRAAVQKIVDSKLLLDPKYTQKPYWTEERRFGTPREHIALQDPIVHDIAQRLNLSEGAWDGLDLMMSWEPSRPFQKTATFVHPVKE
jgi:hypothetical protein